MRWKVDIKLAYAQCRAWGPRWGDPVDVVLARTKNGQPSLIRRTRTCERCGKTKQVDITVQDWGKGDEKRVWPDGYLINYKKLDLEPYTADEWEQHVWERKS